MTETEHEPCLLVIIDAFDAGINGAEALDAVLAIAIFDIAVDVYFCNDGIKQLAEDTSQLSNGKNLAKQWRSAELYGVNNLWFAASSEQQHAKLIDCAKARTSPPKHHHYQHVLRL